jgi:hypothetical protein
LKKRIRENAYLFFVLQNQDIRHCPLFGSVSSTRRTIE